MKVQDLTGAELDCAVADVLGYKAYKEKRRGYELCVVQTPADREPWKRSQNAEREKQRYTQVSLLESVKIGFYGNGIPRFSRDWAVFGPIIEREGISVNYDASGRYSEGWRAFSTEAPIALGPTPLVAACRAYVASKFGPKVQDVQDVEG